MAQHRNSQQVGAPSSSGLPPCAYFILVHSVRTAWGGGQGQSLPWLSPFFLSLHITLPSLLPPHSLTDRICSWTAWILCDHEIPATPPSSVFSHSFNKYSVKQLESAEFRSQGIPCP